MLFDVWSTTLFHYVFFWGKYLRYSYMLLHVIRPPRPKHLFDGLWMVNYTILYLTISTDILFCLASRVQQVWNTIIPKNIGYSSVTFNQTAWVSWTSGGDTSFRSAFITGWRNIFWKLRNLKILTIIRQSLRAAKRSCAKSPYDLNVVE